MPKQLSEAAAWRKLAEWVANRRAYFLCLSLRDWAEGYENAKNEKAPFRAKWGTMAERIHTHAEMGTFNDAEFGPGGLGDPKDNADTRVMFCLLMAHECEEEAKPRPKR